MKRVHLKKIIIILLVAALLPGLAFSANPKLTGSVQVDYAAGLNNGEEYGFNDSTSTSFRFSFDFASAKKETAEDEIDYWVEVSATGNAGYTNGSYKYNVKISKAIIHIRDFAISILGSKGSYNYASSFTKTKGKSSFDYANSAKSKTFDYKTGHGIEIQYKDYSVSLAQYKTLGEAATSESLGSITYMSKKAWDALGSKKQADYVMISELTDNGLYVARKTVGSDAKAENLWIYVGAQTKVFELKEDVSFRAAANAIAQGDRNAEGNYALEKNAGIAAELNYVSDRITAKLDADVDYGQATLNADFLATCSYDILSGGLYFGVSKTRDNDAEKVLEVYVSMAIPAGDYTVNVYAEADRLFLNERTTDLAKKQHFNSKWPGFTVKADTTVDKFTVGAYFNYNQIVDTQESSKQYGMNFGADLTYNQCLFLFRFSHG